MTARKPNPTAPAAHELLFPGHFSTLAVTDPELIEHFDNFAFDEVLRHPGDLPVNTRLMTQLGLFGAAEELTDAQVDHIIATNLNGSIA